jgi:hypothetical protein
LPGPENFKVTQETMGIMTFGQRTAASDMPLTGTARYRLQSLLAQQGGCDASAEDCSGFRDDRTLDADFAKNRLTAQIDTQVNQSIWETDEEGYPITDENGDQKLIGSTVIASRLAGSASISTTGEFAIGLAGTGTVKTIAPTGTPPVPDLSRPLTGSITGAFFGPKAAEVGGIWSIPSLGSDGTVFQGFDAFAGQQVTP